MISTFSMTRKGGTVDPMAGKKQPDATQNLPPEHPTQELPGGTKTGLPTKAEVFAALAKVGRRKPR
jgi:hypothetical protein